MLIPLPPLHAYTFFHYYNQQRIISCQYDQGFCGAVVSVFLKLRVSVVHTQVLRFGRGYKIILESLQCSSKSVKGDQQRQQLHTFLILEMYDNELIKDAGSAPKPTLHIEHSSMFMLYVCGILSNVQIKHISITC